MSTTASSATAFGTAASSTSASRTSASLQCGNTLVVFDGPRRLAWRTSLSGDYTPTALWPSPAQAAQVLEHLYSGGCLLVLLEQERISVPMYAEEADRLPPDVAARADLTSDGVVSELHLPVLDWMPPALRERGLRFLENSTGLLRESPDLLLPHLIVETPPYQPENLRFARLRTPRPFSEDRLAPVTDHLFTPDIEATPGIAAPDGTAIASDTAITPAVAAAAMCPAGTAPAAAHTWETTP
ncbi:hypothetical protein OHS59_24385 [Streptomyces sp. NBC_00414]|uniref:hypothetical protein n=1 Tax=Streptomyces sp. NBC_00414 TaxID=2975739 RepID=UPI002E1F6CBD